MGFFKASTPLILAVSFLCALAQAAPAQPRAIKARDYVTEIVTETVWTTVDITTTVYVDELPFTTAPATTTAELSSSSKEVRSTPSSAPTPSTTSVPEPAAPVPAPPASEPAPVVQAPAAPSSAAGEFAESSAPPGPAYTAPAYTPPAPAPAAPATSEAPAPAPAPAPVALAADNSGSFAGSESASCLGGSAACKGDVTHWDGGLGACGTVVDTEADMAIALPHGFMGTLSNSNPYCGKSVTIKTVSGSTVQATVKDKCMGCVGRSIDLTNKLFGAVTDGKGDGRVSNIVWWFN